MVSRLVIVFTGIFESNIGCDSYSKEQSGKATGAHRLELLSIWCSTVNAVPVIICSVLLSVPCRNKVMLFSSSLRQTSTKNIMGVCQVTRNFTGGRASLRLICGMVGVAPAPKPALPTGTEGFFTRPLTRTQWHVGILLWRDWCCQCRVWHLGSRKEDMDCD